MRAQDENYLFLEPLIVARLQEQLRDQSGTALARVLTSLELGEYETQRRPAPCVDVILIGDEPVSEAAQRDTMVRQTWAVVVVVENRRDSATAVRQDAGVLIAHTLRALQGWEWEDCQRAKRVKSSLRPGGRAGYIYYPLAFSFMFNF
jgi:hypothetical protein